MINKRRKLHFLLTWIYYVDIQEYVFVEVKENSGNWSLLLVLLYLLFGQV